MFYIYRDSESNDSCDQPGDGYVLGDIKMVCHGDYGKQWKNYRNKQQEQLWLNNF